MASKSAKNAQEILMADFQALVRDTEKLLAAKGSGSRGLISVCAAGGQGVVAIVEGC